MLPVIPNAFTKAGIVAGSIVTIQQEQGHFVFLAASDVPGHRARLTAKVRPLLGADLRISQPSASSSKFADGNLRLQLVPGVPEGYGHPKGFYEVHTLPGPEYLAWVQQAVAALRQDHSTVEAVIESVDFGVLWQREALRTYTLREYSGFCVRCGAVRVGSLVNLDHACCASCPPLYGLRQRFCRCCRQPFEGKKAAIFGPCHDWLRALRRTF